MENRAFGDVSDNAHILAIGDELFVLGETEVCLDVAEAFFDAAQAGGVQVFLLQVYGDILLVNAAGEQGNDGNVEGGELVGVHGFDGLAEVGRIMLLVFKERFHGRFEFLGVVACLSHVAADVEFFEELIDYRSPVFCRKNEDLQPGLELAGGGDQGCSPTEVLFLVVFLEKQVGDKQFEGLLVAQGDLDLGQRVVAVVGIVCMGHAEVLQGLSYGDAGAFVVFGDEYGFKHFLQAMGIVIWTRSPFAPLAAKLRVPFSFFIRFPVLVRPFPGCRSPGMPMPSSV